MNLFPKMTLIPAALAFVYTYLVCITTLYLACGGILSPFYLDASSSPLYFIGINDLVFLAPIELLNKFVGRNWVFGYALYSIISLEVSSKKEIGDPTILKGYSYTLCV